MSEQYYEPQGFALEIFKDRYALHEAESFHDGCERLAHSVAGAETNGNVVKFRLEFAELLKHNYFMPGGRIWYGAGRPKGQLLNCFVIPIHDSSEGWGKNSNDMIVISSKGGGIGTNFSPVRPRGADISGHRGKATGAVSPMEIQNSAGHVIKGGGGRRVALMFCLNLNHPDILEFLDKKLDLNQLNNANVSVNFNEDPEVFFRKVKDGEEIELRHGGKLYGKIPADKLWQRMISNALKGGEPGILNGYYANKMSNIGYYAELLSTNPCGEIWLTAYDCCCLGSMVLPRFVKDGKVDWDLLKKSVATSVRFLDNVLTVNNYPLQEIKEMCHTIRRVGLGVLGLHDMLLLLGLKYASAPGLEMIDKVMNFIKVSAYEASIELAKEKGPFPAFDAEKYLKGGFAKTLKPSLRHAIKEHGIRNCALLTIPPTGTTALVCDCSSGIEPLFAPAHIRKFRKLDELAKEIVIHPLFKQFVEEGKSTKHFQGAYDLKLRDHFEVQRACQKHIDNAVSKTINVMPGTSAEELSDLYMEYLPELKGVTIYPEGSREDQPLTPLSIEEALAALKGKGDKILMSYSQDACKDGKCDI
jgi:ribonucleoside-diphosphate reductase alpha chain